MVFAMGSEPCACARTLLDAGVTIHACAVVHLHVHVNVHVNVHVHAGT
jgi:hypothetical protein